MKILYVTTVGLTMIFFKNIIKELNNLGVTVDIACNDTEYPVDPFYKEQGCKVYKIDCVRSPFNKGNLKAIRQIRNIVENGKYDIVHCHTPIAGICTRIACKKLRKKGVKVFYTAHGFHFFKGSPLKNRLIYYPIEKYGSRFTDTLITINTEDYNLAKKQMKAARIEYIPGVGIDVERFKNTKVDVPAKRRELGIPEDCFLILSVGELNTNKNHSVLIKALSLLNNPNIHYAVAGRGALENFLKETAKEAGLEDKIHLLGYRNDVPELYAVSDLYVLPSLREGLNVSLMEAMASGVPVICNAIRGNVDLVINSEIGELCNTGDAAEYSVKIKKIYENTDKYKREAELKHILNFDKEKVNKSLIQLYGIVN